MAGKRADHPNQDLSANVQAGESGAEAAELSPQPGEGDRQGECSSCLNQQTPAPASAAKWRRDVDSQSTT